MSSRVKRIAVIGAGIAGLAAARSLADQGMAVTVYDKGRGVGGRCATRRWEGAVFDHGAQFFTARSPAFQRLVNLGLKDGVVVEWYRAFVSETGGRREHDEPRFRGSPAMTSLPKWLAAGLDVRTSQCAKTMAYEGDQVIVVFDSGESIQTDAVVLTAPVPQSLALLAASEICLSEVDRDSLGAIHYAPCHALMGRLRQRSSLVGPGGVRLETGGPLAWIADNERKGISSLPCVTAHASVAFSRRYLDSPLEEVTEMLVAATVSVLGSDLLDAQVHRWRYAMPLSAAATPCHLLPGPAPIVLAGDGFCGPRVEGAYLSGLAAATALAGN